MMPTTSVDVSEGRFNLIIVVSSNANLGVGSLSRAMG